MYKLYQLNLSPRELCIGLAFTSGHRKILCGRCSEDSQTSHLDVTGDGRALKGTVVEFSDIQPLFKLIGKKYKESVEN